MKSLIEVAEEQQAMQSVLGLTSVFEGLASMRIAQVKDQVLSSQHFFNVLNHQRDISLVENSG